MGRAFWGEGLEWGSYLQVVRAGGTESRLTDQLGSEQCDDLHRRGRERSLLDQ